MVIILIVKRQQTQLLEQIMFSTHSQRLETWLGKDVVERISLSMKDWYGPPIAVQGVPGAVWAGKGGDFCGPATRGVNTSAWEFAQDLAAKEIKLKKARLRRQFLRYGKATKQGGMAGFSSFSDLVSEATLNGKRREIMFNKVGTVGVLGFSNSLWLVGAQPDAGAAGSAAPGGRALTGATVGAQYGLDNVSTDTRHFVYAAPIAGVLGNTLLMYDRIFDVAKTMNSTATQSVTGVPTRYQSITATDDNYAGGNFLFIETGTVLANTAHNWTVCRYRNQADTDTITLPTITGTAANPANRLDMPINTWFCPLATGDTGVKDLDQMQCSGTVATGTINFVIGHPLAWMPCPIANMACIVDGLATSFNLVRVFDDAAIAWLEVCKPSVTATTYTGTATFVHG